MIRATLITSLQGMSRRLTTLVFVLLPLLAFYLARTNVRQQAIWLPSIGTSWVVAVLSLSTFTAARSPDR